MPLCTGHVLHSLVYYVYIFIFVVQFVHTVLTGRFHFSQSVLSTHVSIPGDHAQSRIFNYQHASVKWPKCTKFLTYKLLRNIYCNCTKVDERSNPNGSEIWVHEHLATYSFAWTITDFYHSYYHLLSLLSFS